MKHIIYSYEVTPNFSFTILVFVCCFRCNFFLIEKELAGIILLLIIKSSLSSCSSGKIRVNGLSTTKNNRSVLNNDLNSWILKLP